MSAYFRFLGFGLAVIGAIKHDAEPVAMGCFFWLVADYFASLKVRP